MAAAPHPAPAPPASAAPGADGAVLSLEARLAAVEAAMTVRLDEAAVAHEVRTAHIDTAPVDLADVITVPLTAAPQAAPRTYATPVAALLERARHRMETGGWCAGVAADENGAVCLIGAIRAEAGGNRALEADAARTVLNAIRRRFGTHIDSVPAFNDSFGSGHTPVRMLGEAASMADAQGL
ncbi:hypothetical protein QQY24_01365 [Streptomyces sp. TG1A-8]|uniref:DUF6197 family protein n=1 Tax=Streptomyces sp. TG1A-8 TaxID=3051385 RepID=UPI00265C2B3B|nr:hypothetical protein [Streptomyces sp. TG1A-8]MDO0924133.1 hypothetical protein [Streptomyces sp. TG1A-8]